MPDYIAEMRSQRESSKPREESDNAAWERILQRAHLTQSKLKQFTYISHLANVGELKVPDREEQAVDDKKPQIDVTAQQIKKQRILRKNAQACENCQREVTYTAT